MDFQITALNADQFSHLFGTDSETLSSLGVERVIANENPGFPCRVSLVDAKLGESVLLLNYEHQSASSPYRSSHAIYIREWATEAKPAENEVPVQLRQRLLSVRAAWACRNEGPYSMRLVFARGASARGLYALALCLPPLVQIVADFFKFTFTQVIEKQQSTGQ